MKLYCLSKIYTGGCEYIYSNIIYESIIKAVTYTLMLKSLNK